MSRKKLFIENFLVYGAINGINKIIPLIMLPVITVLLGSTSEFGKFDMFLTIVSFGSSFAMLGIYDALFREYFEKEDKLFQKKIMSTSLIIVIISSVIVLLITISLKDILIDLLLEGKETSSKIIVLAAIAIFFTAIQGIISAPTRVRNERKTFFYSGLLYSVIYYFFSLFLLKMGFGVEGLVSGNLLGIISLNIFFIYKNRKSFNLYYFEKNIGIKLLKIGIPLVPTFLSYWIFKSMDRVFISNLLGLDELGIYSIGARVASISLFVYTAFSGGWQYFAYSTMKDKDQVQLTSKVFEYLSVFTIVLFGSSFLFSKLLFSLLFEGDFIMGYKVFPFLFLSPLLLMLFQTVGNQLIVVKKTYVITISLIIGVCLNLFFNYVLTKNFGIVGSSLATLISYYASILIVLYYCLQKKLIYLSKKLIILHLINILFILYVFIFKNYEPYLFIFSIFIVLFLSYLKEILKVFKSIF